MPVYYYVQHVVVCACFVPIRSAVNPLREAVEGYLHAPRSFGTSRLPALCHRQPPSASNPQPIMGNLDSPISVSALPSLG